MTRDSVAAWMVVSTEMGIGEDRVGGVDAVGIGNLVSGTLVGDAHGAIQARVFGYRSEVPETHGAGAINQGVINKWMLVLP